jgi:hypothetical protein
MCDGSLPRSRRFHVVAFLQCKTAPVKRMKGKELLKMCNQVRGPLRSAAVVAREMFNFSRNKAIFFFPLPHAVLHILQHVYQVGWDAGRHGLLAREMHNMHHVRTRLK